MIIEYFEDKSFALNILKWALLGLLIRVIIMPFSMDADMMWINYLPHQLAAHGNWDPYTFAKEQFAGRILENRNPYYPPLAFYLLASFQFLLQKLTPTLNSWFTAYGVWLKGGGGYALGHASFSPDPLFFRNLFVLKIPLLVFDFAIGLMLLKLASNAKKAAFVFKLWMLNPVVLHSAYASGQLDIYPTFFVMLAVISAMYNRPYLSVGSLTLGALIKSYPIILIPIAIVYLGKKIKNIFKLSLFSLVVFVIFYLPTMISSGGYAIVSLFPGGTIGTSNTNIILTVMKFGFFSSIILLMLHSYIRTREGSDKFNLENYFLIALLLFFAFQPVSVRFYIWLTPFLFLQFTRDRHLWRISLIQLFMLAELRLNIASLWWGLFAPLHPPFFLSLPIPDSFLSPFIDVTYIHKIMYRLFIIITFYMAYRVTRNIYYECKR